MIRFWGRCGFILLLIAFSKGPPPCQAGIYLSIDPNPFPTPSGFSQVRLIVGEYRSVLAGYDPSLGVPEKGSLREQLLAKATELSAKAESLSLPAEMLELTGCWLRTGQAPRVIEFLGKKSLNGNDPETILLLSHLAMAQAHDPALLPRAIVTQEDLLARWPDTIKDWNYPKWHHFRKSEVALLALWRSRLRETISAGGLNVPVQLDSILGLETLGAKDSFKPGKPPRAAWDRIGPEVEGILVQLLFWLPADSRLYWAYGELLNAKGDQASAFKIMTELVEARQMSGVEPLFRHRAILAREIGKLDEPGAQTLQTAPEVKPTNPGEFPMEAYLKALGLGIGIGAGGLLLIMLQWHFFVSKRRA